MAKGRHPDPSMMPFRRGARDTGPPAAYLAAMGAYARAPARDRDHMLVGALCAVLLNELRDPRCSFVFCAQECGCPAQWFEDRALCTVHRNIVREERKRAEQRRNRSLAHRKVKGEG